MAESALMKTPLETLRQICSELSDTEETLTWGKPHFRVAGKIFAGFGEEKGRPVIGLKLDKEHAAERIRSDPRFTIAPYVGRHGWVSIDAGARITTAELRDLVRESYRLIAPKKNLVKLA
jgi:predicted DNA-binding protein (MmcQ/YjbR family)